MRYVWATERLLRGSATSKRDTSPSAAGHGITDPAAPICLHIGAVPVRWWGTAVAVSPPWLLGGVRLPGPEAVETDPVANGGLPGTTGGCRVMNATTDPGVAAWGPGAAHPPHPGRCPRRPPHRRPRRHRRRTRRPAVGRRPSHRQAGADHPWGVPADRARTRPDAETGVPALDDRLGTRRGASAQTRAHPGRLTHLAAR